MWTLFHFFLRLRRKVKLIRLVHLTWRCLRVAPKFLEGIRVQPALKLQLSPDHKFFDENPLQPPCLSVCESRLQSFPPWASPVLFKSLHAWSPREVSIPGDSWLKYRETRVLHISLYNNFQKVFILGKFFIFGFLSQLKSLPHSTPRCFCHWCLFCGQLSRCSGLWSLFQPGSPQVKQWLDGLKFLLHWPWHFCRKIALYRSADCTAKGKGFHIYTATRNLCKVHLYKTEGQHQNSCH